MNFLIKCALLATFALEFLTANASESILYKICSEASGVDSQKKYEFVNKFRKLLIKEEKIIALDVSNCLYLITHPQKRTVLEEFYLTYMEGGLDKTDENSYSASLNAMEAKSTVEYEFSEQTIEQYKILIESLFPDVSVFVKQGTLTLEGAKKEILSIEGMLSKIID